MAQSAGSRHSHAGSEDQSAMLCNVRVAVITASILLCEFSLWDFGVSYLNLNLAGVWARTDCKTDVSVSSQQDLDAISDCKVFNASVHFRSGAEGDIKIQRVERIVGDISADAEAGITSLSSKDLKRVGSLSLDGLQQLQEIQMPVLSSISHLKLLNMSALRSVETVWSAQAH